ncbi:LysM peptidoglycan-binding domain-containing protein, partial [Vibrio chagasii]
LSLTNGAGEKTEYEYDDANHRVTVVSPGGIRTVTEKNAHGETVTITDGLGHQRGFEYNEHGQVIGTTFLAKGADQPEILSSKEYDTKTGLLRFIINAEGTCTEYRYDALGRQWKVIQDAYGEKLETTYAYNAQGQRISENREGRVTTLRFDSQGRKIWVEQGGVGTEYTYDLDGRIIEQVEGALAANGQIQQERVTEYERDVLGAVLEKRVRSGQNWSGRASNRTVSYRYNAAGQIIEKPSGYFGVARTLYDGLGRVKYEINALNYVTAYHYDGANRVVATIRYANALSGITNWQTSTVSKALSGTRRVTEHHYDESGRLAFDVDGLGYATGYEYDAANRVIRTTRYAKPGTVAASPNNRVSESIYDEKGQLRFSISETGAVTERGYDAMGRVTHTIRYDQSVSLQGRSDAEVAAFKAALSQEVQAGRVRSELNGFDAMGRLVFEVDGEGYSTLYTYNSHSEIRRKQVFVNNTHLKEFLKDLMASGDLNGWISNPDIVFFDYYQSPDELNAQTTSYRYDSRGNKIEELSAKVDVLEVDVSGFERQYDGVRIESAYQYDSFGNVVAITNAKSTNMQRIDTYTYDIVGNQIAAQGLNSNKVIYKGGYERVNINSEGGQREKIYDEAGQLRFDIDELGHITEHQYNGFGERVMSIRYDLQDTKFVRLKGFTSLSEIELFVKDPLVQANKRTIEYGYDKRGLQTSVRASGTASADIRLDTIAFNAFKEKTRSERSDGSKSYTVKESLYSKSGHLLAEKDAENYITIYRYNGYGEISTKIEAKNKYTGPWDLSDIDLWIESEKDEDIRKTTFVFDNKGNKKETIIKNTLIHSVENGVLKEYFKDIISKSYFDYSSRITKTFITDDLGATDSKSSISYQYDAFGRIVSSWSAEKKIVDFSTPPKGNNFKQKKQRLESRYFYDAQGNQVKVESADRETFTYYSSQGIRVGEKDAEGNVSYVSIDGMNRVIKETQHADSRIANNVISYAHDITTEYEYDATGRLVLTRKKLASGDIEESVVYNSYGEVINKKINDITTESYIYDALGNVVEKVENGKKKNFQYGLSGKVINESEYYYNTSDEYLAPSIIHREYDLLGNVIYEEKPGVNIYNNVYEDLKNGKKPSYSIEKPTVEQELDRWGNVVKKTVNGEVFNFEYNSRNQLIKQIGPKVTVIDEDGSISFRRPATLYYYDLMGNNIGTQDANGNWQRVVFDSAGTKLIDINNQGQGVFYLKNIHGDTLVRFQPGVLADRYVYDKKSQLISRSKISSGSKGNVVYESFTYDQVGRRTSETRHGRAGYQSFIKYDEIGQVLESHGKGIHRKYTYNVRGSKLSEAWLRDGVEMSKREYGYNIYTGNKEFDILSDGSKVKYIYDQAGLLISKNGAGIDITYRYYNNGSLRMRQSRDKIETYSYDLYGREVWRQLKGYGRLSTYGRTITRTEWDSLGRIKRLNNYENFFKGQFIPGAEIKYYYDAVGNRRKVTSTRGWDQNTRWYHYDSLNREVASYESLEQHSKEEVMSKGFSGCRVIEYDIAGRKINEVEWDRDDNKTERIISYDNDSSQVSGIREYTTYGDNEVMTRSFVRTSAITGHTLSSRDIRTEFTILYGTPVETKKTHNYITYSYQKDGLLEKQTNWRDGSPFRKETVTDFTYHYTGQIASQHIWIYSEDKNMLAYHDTIRSIYRRREPSQRSRITYSREELSYEAPRRRGNTWSTGESTFNYDSAGNLLSVGSTKPESRRSVLSDFDGQIKIQSGGSVLPKVNLTAAGNLLAVSSGETLDVDLLDDSASMASNEPSSYTVKSGDTLQQIAQAVFGDSRYWYLVADANGLSPNEKPPTGQVLVIPNVHTQTFNGAESFKPYNESEVLGDINPEPMPPPPPKKSCNPVAMIVMVVVAVVVTVYTAGAAAPAIAGATGAAAGTATGAAAGAAALAGGATVGMSAGVAMGAAAIGGAMGSIASQLVGKAMGVVDDFSWGQVALGGLAAGATAGFGAALQTGAFNLGSYGNNFASSAVSYATRYMGSKAVGMDVSFSWKSFAASAVGSLVSSRVNQYLNGENNIIGGTIAGFTGSATTSLMHGESLRSNAGQILTDSFGNALGNSIVAGIQKHQHHENQIDQLADRFGIDGDDPNARKTLETALGILGSKDSSTDLRRDTTRDLINLSGASDAQTQEIMGLYEQSIFSKENPSLPYLGEGSESLGDGSTRLEIVITGGSKRAAFGSGVIDDMLIGAGELSSYIAQNIAERPYLEYGLMAIDVATGPAAFVVREAVMATPVGDFITNAQDKALDVLESRFDAAGYNQVNSVHGAGGSFSVAGVALLGAAGLVKGLSNAGYPGRSISALRAQFRKDYDNWAANQNDPRLIIQQGEQRHHTVPLTDKLANSARQKLDSLGLNVNDPSINGVALPNNAKVNNPYGKVLHSDITYGQGRRDYVDYVNFKLDRASTPDQATRILNQIREDLLSGKKPWEN